MGELVFGLFCQFEYEYARPNSILLPLHPALYNMHIIANARMHTTYIQRTTDRSVDMSSHISRATLDRLLANRNQIVSLIHML